MNQDKRKELYYLLMDLELSEISTNLNRCIEKVNFIELIKTIIITKAINTLVNYLEETIQVKERKK